MQEDSCEVAPQSPVPQLFQSGMYSMSPMATFPKTPLVQHDQQRRTPLQVGAGTPLRTQLAATPRSRARTPTTSSARRRRLCARTFHRSGSHTNPTQSVVALIAESMTKEQQDDRDSNGSPGSSSEGNNSDNSGGEDERDADGECSGNEDVAESDLIGATANGRVLSPLLSHNAHSVESALREQVRALCNVFQSVDRFAMHEEVASASPSPARAPPPGGCFVARSPPPSKRHQPSQATPVRRQTKKERTPKVASKKPEQEKLKAKRTRKEQFKKKDNETGKQRDWSEWPAEKENTLKAGCSPTVSRKRHTEECSCVGRKVRHTATTAIPAAVKLVGTPTLLFGHGSALQEAPPAAAAAPSGTPLRVLSPFSAAFKQPRRVQYVRRKANRVAL
eukprot:TRINITY_DN18367_c0_g1_i1.p1 TRINITY_DN18367_c0_g1~~TRINITY_DN18367_c0_g1_i1.p1  ORF type:complete len:392 (-),score=107.43 TRINITY_DN18367_c0_g1_i1:40-1215(-)